MQTEVVDITLRCRTCGQATVVFLRDSGLTDDGEPFLAFRSEKVPHSKQDCEQMVTLLREQWPTLW